MALAGDSGTFGFSNPAMPELVFVVLDDCAVSGKLWLYAEGRTDVEATILVTDKGTGTQKTLQVSQFPSAFAACR